MSDVRDPGRLSPDDRYELAASTEASARRNRPSHLVVLAGLVFVVACGALGLASCRVSSAEADLSKQVARRNAVRGLLAERQSLEATAGDESDSLVTEPYIRFISKMEEVAKNVGVEDLGIPRRSNAREVVGVDRVGYEYSNIRNAELRPLLAFVKDAVEAVPGTIVASLSVKPQAERWVMDVRFERFERTGP